MAGSALKKITTRAKAIRRLHGGSWKAAIKKAGAEYRGGKKMGSTHRKAKHHKRMGAVRPSKRKSVIRKVKAYHAAEGRAIKSLGSVSHHMAQAKSQLKEQIGWAEAQKFAASKKSTKRKIGKRIAALKSQYRKFC
jgi:hypothetical protein